MFAEQLLKSPIRNEIFVETKITPSSVP